MNDENDQRKLGMKVNNMNITNGMEANDFQQPKFKIKNQTNYIQNLTKQFIIFLGLPWKPKLGWIVILEQ